MGGRGPKAISAVKYCMYTYCITHTLILIFEGESEGMHTHTCDTPTQHTHTPHTHTHTHLKHQGEAPDSDAQVLDTLQSLLLPHKLQVVLERKPHSIPVALPLRHPHDVLVQIKQRDLRGLVKIVRRLEQVLDGGVLDNGAHAQLLII